MTKKLNFKIFLLPPILTNSISSQSKLIKGCRENDPAAKRCTVCHRRQLTMLGGCGPLLPLEDPCLHHAEEIGQELESLTCSQASRFTEGTPNSALSSMSQLQAGLRFRPGKVICGACGLGWYPTEGNLGCAPPPPGRGVQNCL